MIFFFFLMLLSFLTTLGPVKYIKSDIYIFYFYF